MSDWERRYRELFAAVWTLPPDEVDVSIEDVAGHLEAVQEAENDAKLAHKWKAREAGIKWRSETTGNY
jgi:hypothetical protein